MEFNKLIELISNELGRFPEIEFAYLFGSITKKDFEKAEDIDIAIFFKKGLSKNNIIKKKLNLESLLSLKIGKDLEITPLNFSTDPLFRHQVLGNKHLLVDRNHILRLVMEAKWRNEYFDMQPLWAVYRRKVFGIG